MVADDVIHPPDVAHEDEDVDDEQRKRKIEREDAIKSEGTSDDGSADRNGGDHERREPLRASDETPTVRASARPWLERLLGHVISLPSTPVK